MKKEIKIVDLKAKILKGLKLRGISDNTAEFMAMDFIEAELDGHSSHGLSKYLLVDYALSKREGSFEVIKEVGNYAIINGHKDLGHVAGVFCADKAVELAKEHGNSIVTLRNASRYSRVKPFAKRIAEQGLIGIIMNNGGPSAVAPYGGTAPIFGTNPICFSFPSKENEPYIFDFSTSKKVWGEIRQAILEKRPLPPNCFYDTDGKFTDDPTKADAVMPFGEAKGYALCYAVEILTGAFVGCKMGGEVTDEYDLGFIFVALSPEMFTSLDEFKNKVDILAKEVRNSRPSGSGSVYVPGDKSKKKLEEGLSSGIIVVDDEILKRIISMEDSFSGGLESNNQIN